MSPGGTDDAGTDSENGRLRADLAMARQMLDRHVGSLGKLQAEFAASRTEAGELRTLIDNQQDYIAALEKHASELRAAMAARESEAAAAAASTAARDAEAARLLAATAAARSELDRLFASLSWRLTAPLRTLAMRVRRS